LHLLKPDGGVQQLKLGDSLQDPDAAPQVNIGVGVWLAAELEDKLSYSLVSQVQAPGWCPSRSINSPSVPTTTDHGSTTK